ncbi:peptidoglycan-binding domain-containing protein [Streptomyces vastus]|uniref:Peptidoglycan binding-like domain-containing protein n=1 Tax=Streptomyces vastus TaxID=285451 RepID=A0ABN3R1Q1_9ACTN
MSIPYDPEPQPSRPALEPTNVQRRRPPGALSELVRLVDAVERQRRNEEYQAVAAPAAETAPPPPVAEATPPPAKAEATAPAWTPGANALPWTTEDDTQELPPVTGEERSGPPEPRAAYGRTPWMRRAALAVAAVAIALAGFAAALLLTWDRGATESQAKPPAPAPSASAPAAPPAAADPDGPGTLRQGDSGPEVSELQERLLKIPDVYKDGATSGEYDATLTEAVARFQLWYGIRGDETGVYGNDTRRDLESRTAS